MGGWMDGWMDGWMNRWLVGWMDVWMAGWVGECVGGCMSGHGQESLWEIPEVGRAPGHLAWKAHVQGREQLIGWLMRNSKTISRT
jgi:hypothetical protein